MDISALNAAAYDFKTLLTAVWPYGPYRFLLFCHFFFRWIVLQACGGLYTIISGMINGPHLKGGWWTSAVEEEREQN